jgi:putative inorganic carbon (HCO3(-)) transporter
MSDFLPDMQNSIFKIDKTQNSYIKNTSWKDWLSTKFSRQNLDNPLVYLFLFSMPIIFSYVIVMGGLKIGVVVIGGVVGLPLLIACMLNLQFGATMVLIISFFLLGVKRFASEVPLGLALDAMIFIMLFGLFVKQINERDWSFAKSPVTVMVLVWIAYNLLEVANPWAGSRIAWVYVVRGMAGQMVMYFIALYAISDLKYASWLIKLWIGLAVLAALHCFYQEFVGLLPYEDVWLNADERRLHLIKQWGRIRKFSFLQDPTVFGVLMAYTSIICFLLMTGPIKTIQRVLLGIAGVMMVMAMSFSGTRTAYVMLPIGLFFYALITLKRNVLIGIGIVFMFGAVIIMMPTSNKVLYRVQSAFNPQESDSYQIREKNQEFIKPFIQSHPMGAGLGSVGFWGKKFNPNSALADFPPDSGYVRIAVEQGWIGLFIYCLLLFTVLKTGIRNYFRTRNPLIKTYYLAFLCMLYALVIANFPQDVLTQVPTSMMFYFCLALLVRLKQFDNQPQSKELYV